MNHYTDKDMTSEEFCNLLKDRLQRGESIDDYSYSSSNLDRLNKESPYQYTPGDGSFADFCMKKKAIGNARRMFEKIYTGGDIIND